TNQILAISKANTPRLATRSIWPRACRQSCPAAQLHFPTRPAAHLRRANPGPPGSHAKCFRTCEGVCGCGTRMHLAMAMRRGRCGAAGRLRGGVVEVVVSPTRLLAPTSMQLACDFRVTIEQRQHLVRLGRRQPENQMTEARVH